MRIRTQSASNLKGLLSMKALEPPVFRSSKRCRRVDCAGTAIAGISRTFIRLDERVHLYITIHLYPIWIS
jgi:hypothetical protein